MKLENKFAVLLIAEGVEHSAKYVKTEAEAIAYAKSSALMGFWAEVWFHSFNVKWVKNYHVRTWEKDLIADRDFIVSTVA